MTGSPRSPLFAAVDLAQAERQAQGQGRWLFVAFTAPWCAASQALERSTWPEPEVQAYLGERAVAVQVDVGAAPEVAERFAVRAMPTLLVRARGEELDRATGALDAKALLAWLRGLERGATRLESLCAAAFASGAARLELARELLARDRPDEAGREALLLWEAGARAPSLVELLSDLVFLAPELHARLTELLRAAAPGSPEARLLTDVLGNAASLVIRPAIR